MLRILFVVTMLAVTAEARGPERPSPSSKPELHIAKVSKSGSVDVLLSPAKEGATRVWSQGNSWGAANWRVFIVRGTQLFQFRENPDQIFVMNVAKSHELRGPTKISLDLRTDVWIGPLTELEGFQSGDEVIVAYDVPVTSEARQRGVWYGTISAMSVVE